MNSSAFAVISDVHGNRWALEAVLVDLNDRGITTVVNLGDTLYGPLDPAGTAALLRGLDIVTVRGNEDRLILESASPAPVSPTLRFVRDQLDDDDLRWLAELPLTWELPGGVSLFHGTPRVDTEYLLWRITASGAKRRSPDEIAAALPGGPASLVLCGHDHVPQTIILPGGPTVVDPGSVGLPAYADEMPYPHVMEAGTPEARYAIVSREPGGWTARQMEVAYDWPAAAAAAQRNGRPDWAAWLTTGRAGV